MKPALRVLEGGDGRRKALAEARARARPLLRQWLAEIERHIAEGGGPRLSHGHVAVARHLTCYPSANEGRCYAGQERIGKAIGRTSRTVRKYLADLVAAGFLSTRRGAPGRTSSWHFEIGGIGLLNLCTDDADRKDSSALDRKELSADRKNPSGLERKESSAKPIEQNPIEQSLTTTTATMTVEPPQGLASEQGQRIGNDALWRNVLVILANRYGGDVAGAWFLDLRIVDRFEHSVTIAAPTKFHSSYVVNHYARAIELALNEIDGEIAEVSFTVAGKPTDRGSP